MSFFKPKRITVRSIIHIAGGLFFFLLPAAEQQKEASVITSDLILPTWELFKLQSLLPREDFSWIIKQVGPAFSRRITRGCQQRGAAEAGSVRVGDKRKEGCWKCLNVWWISENKTGLHQRDLFDFHRLAQPMSGMSHETGCLNSNEYKNVCFSLSSHIWKKKTHWILTLLT